MEKAVDRCCICGDIRPEFQMSGAALCGKKCQKRLWHAKIENRIEEIIPIGVLTIQEKEESFNAKFVLLKSNPLGAGSYGEIYLAQRKGRSKEIVAVKVYGKEVSMNAIKMEIHALTPLGKKSSPYVVQFFEVFHGIFRGEIRNMLVMEYIHGMDVIDLVASWDQNEYFMLFRDWLNFAKKAFNGLAFLHDHGIAHRDVKPDNVMVRSFRGSLNPKKISPVLVDFNFSCTRKECDIDPLGTPGYVGPEGWDAMQPGATNLNALFKATDVWAMTLTMIFLSMHEIFYWVAQDLAKYTHSFTFDLLGSPDSQAQYFIEKRYWIGLHKKPIQKEIAEEIFDGGLNLHWKERKTAREMETLFQDALRRYQ